MTCLILHAEHTINASTFSAMVTASTLANPFASVSAAVGTLAGSLHGGANEDVLNMLDEIGEVKNVRAYIENRLKNKAVIWGLGHVEAVTMAEKVLALIVCSACKIKQASNNLTISSSGSSPNDMVKKFLAYDISLLGGIGS
jgi:hypothetical protein